MTFNKLKTAIVCDWLTDFGGAERVIMELHHLFPEAPIYTSIYRPEAFPQLKQAQVISSFIQKIPYFKTHQRISLPFMPLAFESFDLSDFDLVISSSHCASKGVITKPSTLHICYCHNPMRYVWDDYHSYLAGYRLPGFFKNYLYGYLSKLRIWDRLAADRVDFMVANSECVKQRIYKYYRRDAEVIYPPVNLDRFSFSKKTGDYYLAIGRLIPYKRFDLLVETANRYNLPLKIVGQGRELARLKKSAKSNIEFLGWVKENDLPGLYVQAKALLFPQLEDFGITAVEAMAAGCPVIAYNGGGAKETIVDGVSGVFFNEQTVDSLGEAIKKFENMNFDARKIVAQATNFSVPVFQEKFMDFIKEKWQTFSESSIF